MKMEGSASLHLADSRSMEGVDGLLPVDPRLVEAGQILANGQVRQLADWPAPQVHQDQTDPDEDAAVAAEANRHVALTWGAQTRDSLGIA